MGALGNIWRRWVREDETVFVTRGPRAVTGLMVNTVLRFIVGLGALVVVHFDWGLASAVAGGVLGLFVGRVALGRHRRARAYWSGWLTGRAAFVMSLAEAGQRGMSMDEWLTSQFEVDKAVIAYEDKDADAAVPKGLFYGD